MLSDSYKLDYDGEASGPFVEGESLSFSGGGSGELIILRDDGAIGSMYFHLLSGSLPEDGETITGGDSSAAASVNGTPFQSRFPLYVRDDTSKNASGAVRWTGPSLGTTHSCKYDGEATGPFVDGEPLVFSGGATAELIEFDDDGTSGVLYFRLIGTEVPLDNETITGGTSGATAAVDGVTSERCYTPQEVHYWFADLGDDSTYIGDDVQDRTLPRVSNRVFDTIVTALGNTNIDDEMSYHMYGGSWSQNDGDDLYGGLDVSMVDADGTTEPVIIQNWALLSAATTEYWKNSYMANTSARVRLMVKIRSAGSDIDRKVVRVRALEYLRNYFNAPDVQMGTGLAPVSLVAENDGNNTTAAGTVAGWTDVVLTDGYQTVDHNNGNGAQPYWLTVDRGTRSKTQTHERGKWLQRRGTAETLYGHNYQLIVGNDLDVPYDTELSGPFTEGETITFGNGGTALLLALDDNGVDGVLYCQRMTGDVPDDDDTITGATSGATAAVNGNPATRLITNNLIGTYTGAAFNPANRGITLDADDADTNDLFTDLLGANQSPPNNQQGVINTTLGNVVTVYPYDGASLDPVGDPEPDFDFLILNTTLNGATEASVVVATAIPSWVPLTGFIRITTDGGERRLIAYTGWSGSTFAIPSTDFTGDNATAGNGVMPGPIDETTAGTSVSFTGVYSSDQVMTYKVQSASQSAPKKPSIGTVTFGSGGFSVNVTLASDA